MANVWGVIVSLYYYYLWEIENRAASTFIITYYTMGLYSLLANIILGLFASCGGTSGNKMLMRLFIRISMVLTILFVLLTIYFKCFYLGFYGAALGAASGESYVFSRLITGRTGIQTQDKAILAVKDAMDYVIGWYTVCQIVSTVSWVVLAVLIKYTVSIELWAPDPKVPKLIHLSRQGMNTASLKSMRVIDVVA